jgi:O-antigen/teichoic acid export membrane protein
VQDDVSLRRRDLVVINGSSIGLLTIGLLNTLFIPKMAISAMGIERYGHFAYLLGFCLLPTFLDFGLMPGLTREVGRLYAEDNQEEGRALIRRFQALVAGVGFVVVTGVACAVTFWSRGGMATLLSVQAGAGANILMMVTDLGMITRRVQGRIVMANVSRGLYYLSYLCLITALYFLKRLSVPALFYGQAVGAVAYALAGWLQYGGSRSLADRPSAKVRIPWKRLWGTALPEQANRVQGAFLPSAERTLLLAAGGPAQLGAYDVALRLSAMVTTLPAAIAEPMLALLASRMHTTKERERRLIMDYASFATYAVTGLTLTGGLLVSLYWAVPYYHLENTSFKAFVCFVMIGSGFNVLTATRVAALYAAGKPRPVLLKSLGDLAIAGLALGLLLFTTRPTVYVVCRYFGYFVTAGGLLWYWRRWERKRLEMREGR